MEDRYEDLFQDAFIFRAIGQADYYDEAYPMLVKNRNKKITRYVKYVLNFYQRFRGKKEKKGNLLFLEHRFDRIMRDLSDDYNIFLMHDSINIYKSYNQKKYYQFFYRTWQKLLDKSFFSHDMHYALIAREQIKKFLLNNAINIVFVGNDKRFMEKLLLSAAKSADIPCIVIQHGIYTDEWSFEKLRTADTADNFWSWSQYLKDCYIKRFKKDPEKVRVIGYPFELLNEEFRGDHAVLFIGNNYKSTNSNEGKKYVEIAKSVLDICNELHIKFNYRAHPTENIDESYGAIRDHVTNGNTLLEDLKSNSIIIGDVSSVMIEASLCKRKVVQIVWSIRSKDAANDPMYSFTIKTSDSRDMIKKAIQECQMKDEINQIDSYYMYRDNNFSSNIKSYVAEFINKSKDTLYNKQ